MIRLTQGKGLVLHIAAVRADHDIKFTRFADVVKICIIELEQIGIDGEIDGAALAGFEADALKSLEFLYRTSNAAHHVTNV